MKQLLTVVSILLTLLPLSQAIAQEVVVHQDVRQEEISRNTLRAIFGMRLLKWPDGRAIKVFVLQDDHTTHITFSKSTLHMFPYQLRRAWDRQVYSGTGQSPNEVSSLKEMLEKVASTPGAIGYLSLSIEHQLETKSDLKVLHVW